MSEKKKNSTAADRPSALLILFAVIAVIAVMVFVPKWVKSVRGTDKPSVLDTLKDNELACNVSTNGIPDHQWLCRVAGLPEGYRADGSTADPLDPSLRCLRYVPENAEDAPAALLCIQTGHGSAKSLSEEQYAAYVGTVLLHSEVQTEMINGHEAYLFELRCIVPIAADENGTAGSSYSQSAMLCLQSGYENSCVLITAENTGLSESCFVSSEKLLALLRETAKGLELA